MRLAVTGLGVVSPIGIGREAFWAALREPEAAERAAFAGTSSVLSPELCPGAEVAEVWGWDPSRWLGEKGHRNFDRLTKFLITAAKLGLEDAGLKEGGQHLALGPEAVGICSATAYGSLDVISEMFRVTELEDPRYINPTRFPNTVINAAAGYVSIWEDLRAPNTTVVNGNCGALDALLVASTHLRHGRGAAFLVGGGEVLMEPLYLALRRLGVVGASGGGLRVGEGAAYAVIEAEPAARARGARIHGVVRGYGSAFDPPERDGQLVHASADAVRQALEGALDEAGLRPDEVDAVCASRCGLEVVDAAEREGVAAVFGPEVPVAAPKRVLGETFGAGGALGLCAALSWTQGAPVAPRVAGDAPEQVRNVAVISVGLYGNASAVLVSA
jgi:3-oxoacyl-(acyl-carrier-protein) synthase